MSERVPTFNSPDEINEKMGLWANPEAEDVFRDDGSKAETLEGYYKKRGIPIPERLKKQDAPTEEPIPPKMMPRGRLLDKNTFRPKKKILNKGE